VAPGEAEILLIGREGLGVVTQQEMEMSQLRVGPRLHVESMAGLLAVDAVAGVVPFPLLNVRLYDDALQILEPR
jgi:hypothetical protein